LAEAVEQALGMEVRKIPMTPEYLKARKNED
jgi:CO/xanthine dehydrogenase Mo-binding subunit